MTAIRPAVQGREFYFFFKPSLWWHYAHYFLCIGIGTPFTYRLIIAKYNTAIKWLTKYQFNCMNKHKFCINFQINLHWPRSEQKKIGRILEQRFIFEGCGIGTSLERDKDRTMRDTREIDECDRIRQVCARNNTLKCYVSRHRSVTSIAVTELQAFFTTLIWLLFRMSLNSETDSYRAYIRNQRFGIVLIARDEANPKRLDATLCWLTYRLVSRLAWMVSTCPKT